MARITRKPEILDKIHQIMTKQAEAADSVVGAPGKDTDYSSVSDSTETVDKNEAAPEKLTDQNPSQEVAKDENAPLKDAKTASDISKLAGEVLNEIKGLLSKESEAADAVVGKPGKDTKIESVSDDTEHVDKDKMSPEKLTDQNTHQAVSKDENAPLKKAEAEEIAAKKASYELGVKFVQMVNSKIRETEAVRVKQAELELVKEAARRDVDMIIQNAVASLEQEKQAEEARGAAAFDALHKQAQMESVYAELEDLKQKVASYEAASAATVEKRAAEDKEAQLVARVIEALKREAASK